MQILKDYEKYKLQWMLEHGYTLSDLLEKLAKIINEEMNVTNGNAHVYIDEAFEIFEKEQDCQVADKGYCNHNFSGVFSLLFFTYGTCMFQQKP